MSDPFNVREQEAGSGLTVLVVEDDWFVREDIASGFRQERWTVLEAGTGAGALKLLRETKTIDLLITDIRLADATTGWDVAETVRVSHHKMSADLPLPDPSRPDVRCASDTRGPPYFAFHRQPFAGR